MILSYRDKRTRDVAEGRRVPAYESFRRQAEIRLDRLEASPTSNRSAVFPAIASKHSSETAKAQFSIRIDDQYRICFQWPDGALGPSNVEITDDQRPIQDNRPCPAPPSTPANTSPKNCAD